MARPAKKPSSFIDELHAEIKWLHTVSMETACDYYERLLQESKEPEDTRLILAELGKHDRFFLLTHLLHRQDAIHPWLYERCRELEAAPDDHIDLWARDHYKSTWITFAGSIQEILKDPEITIGIFANHRPLAKDFLKQIKDELEANEELKRVYPEILWQHPRRDATTWSLDDGIVVKRANNPKECTVEAWGLIDSQPTGKHFRLGIFDDIVTLETVNTPDQITKTTRAWEHAQNLLSARNPRRWMIGTYYKYGDTYHQLKERGAAKARLYPATEDGTFDGKPVFLSPEVWEKKKKESSIETIASQQLLNPSAGTTQEFKPDWIRTYETRPLTLNVYIMCDYAGSRKSTGSSRTAIVVMGVGSGFNKYVLDGACHRMDLGERWRYLRDLRRYWLAQPGIQTVEVGYERFGAQSDIEHFQTMMEIEGETFEIKELNWPREGDVAKDNRIRRMIPDHKNWKFFYPYTGESTKAQNKARAAGQDYLVSRKIKQKNEEGKLYDVVEWMIKNEYLFFPNTTAKDFMDAMSRIYDMELTVPLIYDETELVGLPEEA